VACKQRYNSLAQRGWSQRRIAKELGINRETVKSVFAAAKTGHFDHRL